MSVAVLDFQNLSRDSNDTWLGSGLADELTSRLSQVRRLTVASRTAVRRLREPSAMEVTAIGRTLNVAYIVNGTLQRSGSRLRVRAELLRASTGAVEWSNQFDQTQTDLLAIQEAVATAVTSAVAGRLLPEERTTLAARPTRSAEAFALFLRGRELYIRASTDDDAVRAIDFFSRAIALDSGFARAWAGLSIMHSLRYWNYDDRTPARRELARAAADRATRLAPNEAASHIAVGYYHYWGARDYARGLQAFTAALVANPDDPEVHAAIANIARRQGSWEQSLASRSRAIALDSANAGEYGERGTTLTVLRRYDEAERDLRRAMAVDPLRAYGWGELSALYLSRDGTMDRAPQVADSIAASIVANVELLSLGRMMPLWRTRGPHQDALLRAARDTSARGAAGWYLGAATVLAARGRRAEAMAMADSLRVIVSRFLERATDDDGLRAVMGFAWAGLGRCDDALREARRALELMPLAADAFTGSQRMQGLAEIEAGCGQADSAIARVGSLLQMPSFLSVAQLRHDPVWASLRADPRFQRLIN